MEESRITHQLNFQEFLILTYNLGNLYAQMKLKTLNNELVVLFLNVLFVPKPLNASLVGKNFLSRNGWNRLPRNELRSLEDSSV